MATAQARLPLPLRRRLERRSGYFRQTDNLAIPPPGGVLRAELSGCPGWSPPLEVVESLLLPWRLCSSSPAGGAHTLSAERYPAPEFPRAALPRLPPLRLRRLITPCISELLGSRLTVRAPESSRAPVTVPAAPTIPCPGKGRGLVYSKFYHLFKLNSLNSSVSRGLRRGWGAGGVCTVASPHRVPQSYREGGPSEGRTVPLRCGVASGQGRQNRALDGGPLGSMTKRGPPPTQGRRRAGWMLGL